MLDQLKTIYLESCAEELKVNKPGNHSLNSKIMGMYSEKVFTCFKNFSKVFNKRKSFSWRNDFLFNKKMYRFN